MRDLCNGFMQELRADLERGSRLGRSSIVRRLASERRDGRFYDSWARRSKTWKRHRATHYKTVSM